MAKGSARGGSGSGGENIQHFGSIRIRVTGSGVLRARLLSLDDVRTQTLPTLTMAAATNIQPTILANFTEQRAALELSTTAINEFFRVNRIIVYMKTVATGYPQ